MLNINDTKSKFLSGLLIKIAGGESYKEINQEFVVALSKMIKINIRTLLGETYSLEKLEDKLQELLTNEGLTGEIINELTGNELSFPKIEEKEYEFGDEIAKIIKDYKEEEGNNEALDGDEVDRLTKHLRNRINLFEGNITEEEYQELEDGI